MFIAFWLDWENHHSRFGKDPLHCNFQIKRFKMARTGVTKVVCGTWIYLTHRICLLMKNFFQLVLSRLSFISVVAQMTRVSTQFEKSNEINARLVHSGQVRRNAICSYLDVPFSCFEFWKENVGIVLTLYLTLLGGNERLMLLYSYFAQTFYSFYFMD